MGVRERNLRLALPTPPPCDPPPSPSGSLARPVAALRSAARYANRFSFFYDIIRVNCRRQPDTRRVHVLKRSRVRGGGNKRIENPHIFIWNGGRLGRVRDVRTIAVSKTMCDRACSFEPSTDFVRRSDTQLTFDTNIVRTKDGYGLHLRVGGNFVQSSTHQNEN